MVLADGKLLLAAGIFLMTPAGWDLFVQKGS